MIKKIFLILPFISLINGAEQCLKTQDGDLVQRGVPYGSLEGCYVLKDNYSETTYGLKSLDRPGLKFSSPYQDWDKNLMDPVLCTIHCGNYFFKYAALRKGNECRCVNATLELAYTPANESKDCDMKCIGNSTYKCGGERADTVYEIRVPNNKIPEGENIGIEEKLDIMRGLKNGTGDPRYLSCLKDSQYCNQRLLNDDRLPEDRTITVDKCIEYCKSSNFKYAGLEIGNQCYCGHSYTNKEIDLDPEHCSSSCVGNKTQICGGSLALSVYNASRVEPIQTFPPKGGENNDSNNWKIPVIVVVGSVSATVIVIGAIYYYPCCRNDSTPTNQNGNPNSSSSAATTVSLSSEPEKTDPENTGEKH